ncbi:MAG TPA: hypothetical protein DCQ40_02695, partial [Hyphomonas sp.]|nr:hypothetical protein [Hyphomonas sp.]
MAQGVWRAAGWPGQTDEGDREGECAAASRHLRSDSRQPDPSGSHKGKVLSPSRKREAVDHVVETLGATERRACRVIGQHRSTQRKPRVVRQDEDVLTAAIIALAERFGRYGYRRITALLRRDGWHVNEKRVYRIWRREGLKVPMKQPKRGRLWLNDGSCIRLRPMHKGHVWSYDFVQDRTHAGKVFR